MCLIKLVVLSNYRLTDLWNCLYVQLPRKHAAIAHNGYYSKPHFLSPMHKKHKSGVVSFPRSSFTVPCGSEQESSWHSILRSSLNQNQFPQRANRPHQKILAFIVVHKGNAKVGVKTVVTERSEEALFFFFFQSVDNNAHFQS